MKVTIKKATITPIAKKPRPLNLGFSLALILDEGGRSPFLIIELSNLLGA